MDKKTIFYYRERLMNRINEDWWDWKRQRKWRYEIWIVWTCGEELLLHLSFSSPTSHHSIFASSLGFYKQYTLFWAIWCMWIWTRIFGLVQIDEGEWLGSDDHKCLYVATISLLVMWGVVITFVVCHENIAI